VAPIVWRGEISFGLRVYRWSGFAYNRDPRRVLEVSVIVLRKIVLKGPDGAFSLLVRGPMVPFFVCEGSM
jgi:hypothetical protein